MGIAAVTESTEADGPSADDAPIVLAEEVVPGGKHQGKTFKDVAEDDPFCKWLLKEPRKGWMGMLKVYLETECGMEAPAEEVEEVDAEADAEATKVAAARAKFWRKVEEKHQQRRRSVLQ